MFWFVLFTIVLIFGIVREHQYLFIYYTFWSFTLEIVYFGLLYSGKPTRWLYGIILAPSIVVCCGFWIVIAPAYSWDSPLANVVLTVVTHGLNMIAMLMQSTDRIQVKDVWKPVLFTSVYNLFLAVYVGSGGRSISGQLPYWYAQYDRPIGWVFAALSVIASAVVHVGMSTLLYKHTSTSHIV